MNIMNITCYEPACFCITTQFLKFYPLSVLSLNIAVNFSNYKKLFNHVSSYVGLPNLSQNQNLNEQKAVVFSNILRKR